MTWVKVNYLFLVAFVLTVKYKFYELCCCILNHFSIV